MKFNKQFREKVFGEGGAEKYNRLMMPDLSSRAIAADEALTGETLLSGARIYRQDNLTSQSVGRDKGEGAASWFPVQIDGRAITPSQRVRWKTNEVGMRRLLAANRVEVTGDSLAYVRYLNDFRAIEINNLWDDVGGVQSRSDPKVYVVQSPNPLVQRVPHPVSWTHVCATRHGVARTPDALRVACDTRASQGASTGCSVRRTRRRPRAPRQGFERPGRRRLAP